MFSKALIVFIIFKEFIGPSTMTGELFTLNSTIYIICQITNLNLGVASLNDYI